MIWMFNEGVIGISSRFMGTYTELKKAAMAGPDQILGLLEIATCR